MNRLTRDETVGVPLVYVLLIEQYFKKYYMACFFWHYTVLYCTALHCRYLSHGQEWSEKLRLEDRTRTVKRSLDPVWDEEFSLPIRR